MGLVASSVGIGAAVGPIIGGVFGQLLGWRPLRRAAGLVLTPGAVAQAILSPVAGRLSDRVGVRLPVLVGLGIMALSVLFISTFAGASPELIAAGILGVGTGFAFIQSPANNAAANSLPEEEVGGGMGIFAGAFFLGSGTGPALIGAFLAAREESDRRR